MEPYVVLARKYRPRVFEEVVGQGVMTGVLAGAIEEGRIGHAYLFCGPRGTGKTTTARILAKALNCEQGPTAKPCGVCDRCKASDEGHEVDVVEIDAASHTGVDNIRELRDQAGYAPLKARFKVYVIDEVHMLSKAAFNALLKTLEEPPAHVKFLFATTEPQQVLDTILSRCQVLRLSLISEEEIAAALGRILEKEGVQAGADVLRELAQAARGSMRDALTLTDQLLALVGDAPTAEDVRRLGGRGGARAIGELLDQVEAAQLSGILACLPESEGVEADFLSDILDHLRAILLVALRPREAELLEPDAETRAQLDARARRLGPSRLQLWIEELLHARERMRLLPRHARLVLETALLDLAREETTVPLAELERRLMDLESRVQGVANRHASPARPVGAPEAVAAPESGSVPRTPAPAAPSSKGPSSRGPGSAGPAPIPAAAPIPANSERPATVAPAAPPEPPRTEGDSAAPPPTSPEVPARGEPLPAKEIPAAPPKARAATTPAKPKASPKPSPKEGAKPKPSPKGAEARGSRRGRGDSRGPGPAGASSKTPKKKARAGAGKLPPRGAIGSDSQAYQAFLHALGREHAELAEALGQRGKLVDLSESEARIQTRDLAEDVLARLGDGALREHCEHIFSEVVERPVTLAWENATGRRPGDKDPFTREVADLFSGQIEEDR